MKNFKEIKEEMELTHNVIIDDLILFRDDTFGGSFRKPKYLGCGWILGKVIKESYGDKSAQHTFSISVIQTEGMLTERVTPKKVILRKGRNLYKECYLVERSLTDDEESNRILDKNRRSKEAKLNRYNLWQQESNHRNKFNRIR